MCTAFDDRAPPGHLFLKGRCTTSDVKIPDRALVRRAHLQRVIFALSLAAQGAAAVLGLSAAEMNELHEVPCRTEGFL